MKTILHVDMDAFYASVEQHDNPTLRGKPVIVGGSSRRGVVLAASYEVRPFGVRSAMSMMEAMKRAPHAIVVPPRHDRYLDVSAQAFGIFRRFTPLVEPLSPDEAFLDVTASRALFGDGEQIAAEIKKTIRSELGMTASAGVAPCKFVAKIASDLRKPDGLLVVPADGIAEFLAPLPIERMWGVGPKTAPKMRALGLATLGDLARADPEWLERHLGAWGERAVHLARGEDDRDVDPQAAARSIGAELTYEEDIMGNAAVARTLLAHARKVARRMMAADVSARIVVVKVKYADFTLRTRRLTLPEPVQDTDSLYQAAVQLLERFPLQDRRVRLTGVSVAGIVGGGPPRLLVADAAEKRTRLERVTADIAKRFDETAVTRATLIDRAPAGKGR